MDIRLVIQVGNGSGNLQDPVVGPSREAQFVNGGFQKIARRLVDTAVLPDMAAAHLGIAVDIAATKTPGLLLSCRADTFADLLRWF